MKKMTKNCLSALLVISVSGFYGCSSSSSGSGGGGQTFTGNSEAAAIDSDNAQEIGEAAGEAVGQAASSEASSAALPIGVEVEAAELTGLDKLVYDASQLALLPSGFDVSSSVCPGGGSANISYSGGTISTSGPVNMTINFNNCTTTDYGSGSSTIDGRVHVEYEDIGDLNAGFSIVYDNVTVSGLGFGTQTVNYSFSCTNLSDYTTCTTSSVFVGSDGGSHQISEYSFSGSSSSGYSGSATFSHETYGSVSISVSNVTYGNCGSAPDGGSISFSSTTGTSGEITFNSDCTTSGSWNNGTSSGSF